MELQNFQRERVERKHSKAGGFPSKRINSQGPIEITEIPTQTMTHFQSSEFDQNKAYVAQEEEGNAFVGDALYF